AAPRRLRSATRSRPASRSSRRARRSSTINRAATLLDEVPDPVPADAAPRYRPPVLVRQPDEQGLALDVLDRDGAPHARIVGVRTIVAHHEHVAVGHDVVQLRLAHAGLALRLGLDDL